MAMDDELYVNKVAHINLNPELYWKSMTQKERENAPCHCGPDGSYPLGPGCAHVDAARDLAKTGHGTNPQKILECIERYAKEHGCG